MKSITKGAILSCATITMFIATILTLVIGLNSSKESIINIAMISSSMISVIWVAILVFTVSK